LAGVALSISFIGITSIIVFLISLPVPLPFVNGIVALLLALIPYIGAILNLIPPQPALLD
jgi:predicted PurR-regulated permease PerM